jgi:hypothetical protein
LSIKKEDSLKKTEQFIGKLGIVLCSALLRFSAYGQPSASIEVTVPSVEIHAVSDFYEPLTPEGEWVVIGSYGRCWRPHHVESDWRPYCNGSWERTDAGWYWVSDEPWGWATYHYGRWDYSGQDGWYWVPQTQWAPAWVSWHEGGGYIGWAPLQPSVSISVNGFVGYNESRISPRAYVFVQQNRFLEPVRPSIVVVNNTTIIRNTRTVTNARIVNNRVVNEGPATAVIEKASGRKVVAMPVQELRHNPEAAVVARERNSKSTAPARSQAPARNEAQPEKKTILAREPRLAQKPDVITPEQASPSVKKVEARRENINPAPANADPKPAVKPEANPRTSMKGPAEQNPERQPARQEKPARAAKQVTRQPARETPAAVENNGGNQPEKGRDNKP